MTQNRTNRLLDGMDRFLSRRLNVLSRLWLVVSAVCLVLSLLFPLWQINLVAPQYPDGLDLWIYSYKIEAGNEGQDLKELNILNHYIGMQEIEEADFTEMRVIPFALGMFILLGLRSAVFGRMRSLIDVVVLYLYFCLFSLGTFLYRMYSYGHHLDPQAPINPDPFWPALFGTKQIANMTETSLPRGASYLLLAAFVCLLLAVFHSRREPPFFEDRAREA